MFRELNEVNKNQYNQLVTHPLQSWEWGEFRNQTGVKVVRIGIFKNNKLVDGFQLTFHPIPYTSHTVGYFPKGKLPTQEMITALKEVGQKHNAIFIKLEPNVENNFKFQISNFKLLKPSPKPLFTKYTFYIDLTKSEDELLKSFESKTRYNIRVAQKHGVTIQEENTREAFKRYLELTAETTRRQGFYAHSEKYHRLMWEHLNHQLTTHNLPASPAGRQLTTHLLTARYQGKILVTWVLFLFNNVLYYPYGASSNEHKNVMASNLMMWEAIHWGKKNGAQMFDLWGTPGPDPKPADDYYGFHKFKLGYNPKLVEFIGTYDLILKQPQYRIFQIADKLRWWFLKLKTK